MFPTHLRLTYSNDGVVIFDTAAGQVYVANQSAAVVCKALESGSDLLAAARALQAEYNLEPDTAIEHTKELYAHLAALRLFDGEA